MWCDGNMQPFRSPWLEWRAAYAEIKLILLTLTLTLTLTPTTDPPKRFPYFIPYVSLRQKPRVVYCEWPDDRILSTKYFFCRLSRCLRLFVRRSSWSRFDRWRIYKYETRRLHGDLAPAPSVTWCEWDPNIVLTFVNENTLRFVFSVFQLFTRRSSWPRCRPWCTSTPISPSWRFPTPPWFTPCE